MALEQLTQLAPAAAALGTVWSGAAVIGIRALQLAQRNRYAAHRAAHALPVIASTEPYMPAGNPWRVGSTVLVCEDLTRPEQNFFGTVISTSRHMVTIRDTQAPYHAVETEKQYVYHPDTIL